MSPYLKWPLAALTIIGSILGAGLTLFHIPFALLGKHNASAVLIGFFTAASLYAFGIIAGVLFAQNSARRRPLQIYYALQLFWLSAPHIGCRFISGAHIVPGLAGENLTFSWGLGSVWHFGSSPDAPWGLGLNLVALLALWILRRGSRRPKKTRRAKQ